MDTTLDAVEVRVLGSLVEKELSTPDYYPMTLNALTAACNQKSNRDPVVRLEEEEVARAVDALLRRRLVGNATAAHQRTPKFRHALAERLGLEPPELAVLASLMLRGPETTGEIRARMGRMHTFESLDEVQDVLQRLVERDEPIVMLLPRRTGQKEQRYAHLLSGPPDVDDEAPRALEVRYTDADRLTALEEEVQALRDEVERLRAELQDFRRQFE